MAKISASNLLDELEETFNNYMAAIAKIEDSEDLDEDTKSKAASIINQSQIHGNIALDTITN